MEAKEKQIALIRKLLALGGSSFEEEARTALYKAFSLMKTHGISLADVAGTEAASTGEIPAVEAVSLFREHMRSIASAGGRAGGPARARSLSAKRRKEIAQAAGKASAAARKQRKEGR